MYPLITDRDDVKVRPPSIRFIKLSSLPIYSLAYLLFLKLYLMVSKLYNTTINLLVNSRRGAHRYYCHIQPTVRYFISLIAL